MSLGNRWEVAERLMRRLSLDRKTIYITAACVLIGLAVSLQWQAKSTTAPITRESTREQVSASVQRLEDEQNDLKEQIGSLRAEIASFQADLSKRKVTLSGISDELERQKMAAGFVPVKGKGLKVTLNDSSETAIAEGEDPEKYLIHEYDLRDVVNSLWAAGAEAVSVNQERIVGVTSIYCVGSTIMVNDTRMSPPYEIRAIGDPSSLLAAVEGSEELAQLRARAGSYKLGFEIEEAGEVVLPAYSGSFILKVSDVNQ